MRFLLPLALAASLLTNLWFALRPTIPIAGAPPAPAAPATARSPAAPVPFTWQIRGTGDAELRQLGAELRAAGFPPFVVARFINHLLRERLDGPLLALSHWQFGMRHREFRERRNHRDRELLSRQEAILGPDGSEVGSLDPTHRATFFGDLPDAAVAAALRIDRDYRELLQELDFPPFPPDANERRLALERARLAELAAHLTPAQLEELLRRQSPHATRVRNALGSLTLSEAEYGALVSAMRERSPDLVDSSRRTEEANDAALAHATRIRTILGDDRALEYLSTSEPAFGEIAAFTARRPSLDRGVTFTLFQLQGEASSLARSLATRPLSDADRARYTDLNRRLDALLGPERAAAYRQQGAGRRFDPEQRSSTLPTSLGGFRLGG